MRRAGVQAYERILARRPVAVKTAAAAAIAFCGDATAQHIEQLPYDVRRGLGLSSLGAFWNGPFLHAHFGALDRRFPQLRGGLRPLLTKWRSTSWW